jgi:rhodanese-related sulfurtransferase
MRAYFIVLCWLVSFPAMAELKDIDNQALQQLLKEKVTLVDIRTPEEWKETGIIEGSQLLTFFDKNGRYNIENWMKDFEKIIKKDQAVILICRTGNRTLTVGNFLDKKMGYQTIYNVKKGISEWIKAGNPIVKKP